VATECHQVNLQRGFGGGEVYTAFFSHALSALGVRTVLYANRGAAFWEAHLPREAKIVRVSGVADILRRLPAPPCWLAFHTPASEEAVAPLRAAGHRLTAFAHMPLYGRDPASLRPYRVIFAVSRHVLASLQAAAIPGVYPEPLYGVARLDGGNPAEGTLEAASPYDWDRRKLRDRVFGLGYAFYERWRRPRRYDRLPGIALGIVSRLTPIKQFPLLFRHLSPVLARHPQFRLEIFGAGGYASVRDLRRSLAPIRERVRFWGAQANVAAVYRRIDYLLTGLPEKEALGLNVLEAQACGCPVLAVGAPPFTETVADEVTGLLYPDPRADRGAGFEWLLTRLATAPFKIDEAHAVGHLGRFSAEAFRARVAKLLEWLAQHGFPAHRADGCG